MQNIWDLYLKSYLSNNFYLDSSQFPEVDRYSICKHFLDNRLKSLE